MRSVSCLKITVGFDENWCQSSLARKKQMSDRVVCEIKLHATAEVHAKSDKVLAPGERKKTKKYLSRHASSNVGTFLRLFCING
jgi:hypothetical protein